MKKTVEDLFAFLIPDNKADKAFRERMRRLGWSHERIEKVIRKEKEKRRQGC